MSSVQNFTATIDRYINQDNVLHLIGRVSTSGAKHYSDIVQYLKAHPYPAIATLTAANYGVYAIAKKVAYNICKDLSGNTKTNPVRKNAEDLQVLHGGAGAVVFLVAYVFNEIFPRLANYKLPLYVKVGFAALAAIFTMTHLQRRAQEKDKKHDELNSTNLNNRTLTFSDRKKRRTTTSKNTNINNNSTNTSQSKGSSKLEEKEKEKEKENNANSSNNNNPNFNNNNNSSFNTPNRKPNDSRVSSSNSNNTNNSSNSNKTPSATSSEPDKDLLASQKKQQAKIEAAEQERERLLKSGADHADHTESNNSPNDTTTEHIESNSKPSQKLLDYRQTVAQKKLEFEQQAIKAKEALAAEQVAQRKRELQKQANKVEKERLLEEENLRKQKEADDKTNRIAIDDKIIQTHQRIEEAQQAENQKKNALNVPNTEMPKANTDASTDETHSRSDSNGQPPQPHFHAKQPIQIIENIISSNHTNSNIDTNGTDNVNDNNNNINTNNNTIVHETNTNGNTDGNTISHIQSPNDNVHMNGNGIGNDNHVNEDSNNSDNTKVNNNTNPNASISGPNPQIYDV